MWYKHNLEIVNTAHTSENIIVNGENTHIPYNLPSAIIASKGYGKSTLISTMLKAFNASFKYLIYVYSSHVDTTLAETYHDKLLRISTYDSEEFLTKYLSLKMEFMSWSKFIVKNSRANKNDINQMLTNYNDNIIDNFIRTSKKNPFIKACAFVDKYSSDFKITVNGIDYKLSGFEEDQHDMLIIDDIGAVPLLFPQQQYKSPIYKFITTSRHLLLCSIFSGQDFMQLPKYLRKEINTWIIGYGVDINGIAETNINEIAQKKVKQMYQDLEPFQFIIYNGLENTTTML